MLFRSTQLVAECSAPEKTQIISEMFCQNVLKMKKLVHASVLGGGHLQLYVQKVLMLFCVDPT